MTGINLDRRPWESCSVLSRQYILLNSTFVKFLFLAVKILTRFNLSTDACKIIWIYYGIISYIINHFLFKVPNLPVYFASVLLTQEMVHDLSVPQPVLFDNHGWDSVHNEEVQVIYELSELRHSQAAWRGAVIEIKNQVCFVFRAVSTQ